jgi:hypothetical protein
VEYITCLLLVFEKMLERLYPTKYFERSPKSVNLNNVPDFEGNTVYAAGAFQRCPSTGVQNKYLRVQYFTI